MIKITQPPFDQDTLLQQELTLRQAAWERYKINHQWMTKSPQTDKALHDFQFSTQRIDWLVAQYYPSQGV